MDRKNSKKNKEMSSILDPLAGNYKKNPEEASLGSRAKELLQKTFEDIPEGTFCDYHMHVLGLGNSSSGIWLHDDLFSLFHPMDAAKTRAYINAAGIENKDRADTEYLEQMVTFVNLMPVNGTYFLLALDRCYTPEGELDEENSKMYVPNDWVYKICLTDGEKFKPCISVNPYRKDALQELEKWAEKGVKMVKWMPAIMGMDASDPICEPFYRAMERLDMVLLTHVGKEDNVPVSKFQPLNNPLLFRKALDMGVKVIMAHCASAGQNKDLDNDGKTEENYLLFIRLMDEKMYEGQLFGDISAITQVNRMGKPLAAMLERQDLHPRLLHGSDYPLPALNAVISTKLLVSSNYLEEEDREPLNEIYKWNPLVFDYVLKRTVHHPADPTKKFSASMFIQNRDLGLPVESVNPEING